MLHTYHKISWPQPTDSLPTSLSQIYLFFSRSHSHNKTSTKSNLNHNQSTKLTKKNWAPSYAVNKTQVKRECSLNSSFQFEPFSSKLDENITFNKNCRLQINKTISRRKKIMLSNNYFWKCRPSLFQIY